MAFDFSKGTVVQTGRPTTKEKTPQRTVSEKKEDDAQNWFEKYIITPLEWGSKAMDVATGVTGIKQATEFVGTAGGRIGEGIAYATDPLVREMSQGEAGKDILPFTGDLLDAPASKVAKKIGGESLQTAAQIAPWKMAGITGKVGVKALKFGLAGGAIGGSRELAEQMQDDEDINVGDISKEAIKDGLISATLSVVFDKAYKTFQNRATKAYGKAFKPSTKSLQSDIEKGRDTINTRMAKEGYSGNPEKILNSAKTNKNKYGNEVIDLLKKSDKTVTRKEATKGVEKLFDQNDILDEWELKLIVKQINKIPDKMTLVQANEFKKQFAAKVSPSAWDTTASKADTFRNKMYKTISGDLRESINTKYGRDIIKKLQEKWALSNDVLGLASYSIAQAQGARGLGSELAQHPSFYTLLSTPFRPFTTVGARTFRGQMYQRLSNLGKDELTQRLMQFITLEEIQ